MLFTLLLVVLALVRQPLPSAHAAWTPLGGQVGRPGGAASASVLGPPAVADPAVARPGAGIGPSVGTGPGSRRGSGVNAGPGSGRAWPVGARSDLLRRFNAPPARWAAGHRGVDLAASEGMTVRAAAPGVVSFVGMVAGRPVVTVTHPSSGAPPLRTTYLPVTGSVPVGTPVSAGQPIGTVATGTGHCATGCLHWGLLRGKRYLDPLALLGSGQARLLPLDGP
ncbi:murein hydrolase activator EnvC family protein [Kitasatospora sp. NPDC056138]|uniref:murein hydrolase activator EnvC family protein n=1 Tax=Kitasatospora sp. NPDC056138 TaxID=3345724 RepID=UPI0035D609D1